MNREREIIDYIENIKFKQELYDFNLYVFHSKKMDVFIKLNRYKGYSVSKGNDYTYTKATLYSLDYIWNTDPVTGKVDYVPERKNETIGEYLLDSTNEFNLLIRTLDLIFKRKYDGVVMDPSALIAVKRDSRINNLLNV